MMCIRFRLRERPYVARWCQGPRVMIGGLSIWSRVNSGGHNVLSYHNPKSLYLALAKVAAAFEAAADAVNLLAGDDHTIRWAMDEIRALTSADAQEALDKMLKEAREQGDYYEGIQEGYRAGIREAADIVNKNRDISGWVSHDAILALLNEGGRDE